MQKSGNEKKPHSRVFQRVMNALSFEKNSPMPDFIGLFLNGNDDELYNKYFMQNSSVYSTLYVLQFIYGHIYSNRQLMTN